MRFQKTVVALCVGALVLAPATGAFADEAPQDPAPAVSAEAQQVDGAAPAEGPAETEQPAAPAPVEEVPATGAPAPTETPDAGTVPEAPTEEPAAEEAPAVAAQQATVTAQATISGSATIGSVLKASTVSLQKPAGLQTKSPVYTWYANGTKVATGTSYAVPAAMLGKRISLKANVAWAGTAEYLAGDLVYTTKSASTAPVARQKAPVTAVLRASGHAQVGKSLSASITLKRPSDLKFSSSFTWYLNGKHYGGGRTLKVTPAMAGKKVSVYYRASWAAGKYNAGSTVKVLSYTVRANRPATMVRSAYAQLGARQDCTALIERALRASGKRVGDLGTRSTEYVGVGGKRVSALQPGDVMIWEGRHVAMYIGNGKAIHSGYAGNQTVVASAYLDGRPSSIVRFA